jgi:ABC-type multidrug transport system ATPase subunit
MELLAELHATGSTILMVTHNPELTRYATRVLYMHDGSIVHDESTRLGEVPLRARTGGEEQPINDEDEQLSGVSAYLSEIPAKAGPARKHLTTKKTKKPAKTRKKTTKKKVSRKESTS